MDLTTSRRDLLVGSAGLTLATTGFAPAWADSYPSAAAYQFPFSGVFPFRSQFNGIDYKLYVRVPPDYAESGRSYPLIVLLDADYSFVLASNIVEHLSDRMNQGPKVIVAAIAYQGIYPSMHQYRLQRTRDYTPISFPTGGYGPEYQKVSGGGPSFLRMLEQEALPLLERKYRLAKDERTLVGHSYGGLFASWMLQDRPDLFNRYLIVSPSLWYADRLILKREKTVRWPKLARRTMAYLAVGSWEEQPGNGGYMVTELNEFAGQLADRADPNLVVKHRVFEDETHASIFPAAFSTGVRNLFGAMSATAQQ